MASTVKARVFRRSSPQVNGRRVFRAATVSNATMAQWIQQTTSIPERKLKNWKSATIDQYGCRCQVRYSEVPLPIGPAAFSMFQMRLSTQSATDFGLPAGSWIPVQSLSTRAEIQRIAGSEHELVAGEKELITDDETHISTAFAETESRSTGNHRPHRHRISIPTAAGEPVRG